MIYLIRHGETDWNKAGRLQGHTDIELNEIGLKQAKLASQDIKKYNIKHIYTSNLLRAVKTAQIVNNDLGLDIKLDVRLKETKFGDFEGRLASEITPQQWQDFNENPKNFKAENWHDLYIRVKSFYEEVKEQAGTLIVTHAGTARMLLYVADNDEFNQAEFSRLFKENKKIANCEVIKIK